MKKDAQLNLRTYTHWEGCDRDANVHPSIYSASVFPGALAVGLDHGMECGHHKSGQRSCVCRMSSLPLEHPARSSLFFC